MNEKGLSKLIEFYFLNQQRRTKYNANIKNY